MKLSYRLLLPVFVAIIPATGGELWNGYNRHKREAAAIEQKAFNIASLVANEHDRLVDGIYHIAITLSNTPNIGDIGICQPLLARLKGLYPPYLDIYSTDSLGFVQCATDGLALGLNFADRSYWMKAVVSDAFTMGEFTVSRSTHKAALPFAIRRQTNGVASGIIVVALDVSWLNDLIRSKPMPPGSVLVIADRQGTVLAHGADDNLKVGTPLPHPFMAISKDHRSGVMHSIDASGSPTTIGYVSPVTKAGQMFVAVSLPSNQAFLSMGSTTFYSVTILATIAAVTLGMAWWGGRRLIVTPVKRLMASAERWSTGDWSTRSGFPHGPDEFSLLAQAFDKMAMTLQRQAGEKMMVSRRLAESQALSDAIVEGVPDPIFVKDREGRYILINSATARVLGLPRERIQGCLDEDFLPPDVSARIRASDLRVIRTGMPELFGEEVPDTNLAQVRWFQSSKAPLRDETGTVTGVIGIAQEITKRRQAEREAQDAKSEAERANLAKSRFLTAASHDLRQPMQALFMLVGVLKGQLGGNPAGDTVEVIQRALDAQKIVLDGMTDIARLDAGLVVPQVVDVDMGQVLEEIVVGYAYAAQSNGLRLRLVRTKAVVRTDPSLLARILRHLIENALRFTERGGIVVGCRNGLDKVRIEIVDSGPGVADEVSSEIWEEFYQLGNPERDRTKGLGLGLAIVGRLGRLLGHTIRMRSAVGKGSIFSVELQRAAVTSKIVSAPSEGGSVVMAPSLIVIIDDEALIRLSFKAMLEGWGYEVLAAASALDAVEAVGDMTAAPDLIIADYRLQGGRTGTEAIRALHQRFGNRIPAIIVTGDSARDRLVEARDHGHLLLHKPISPIELQRHIVRILRAA